MGLDFSVDIPDSASEADRDFEYPHWSYSGFNRFRTALAKLIGIDLSKMPGFCDNSEYSWDDVKDAIVPLLYHSDCDGTLSPSKCKSIAPRLRELAASLDEYDKHKALLLARLMELSAKYKKSLQFC